MDIDKKRADRFRFLHRLYEITDGDEHEIVVDDEIGKALGLTSAGTDKVGQYLEGEGLIKYVVMGGGISITHRGRVEIERALAEPDKPTRYFPPTVNILNVHSIVNSQVQQGVHDSAQTQTVDPASRSEVVRLLSDIKAVVEKITLTTERRQDVAANIATVEAQLLAASPRRSIIREALASVRNVLEQVAGNVAAQQLVQALAAYLTKQ